MINKEIKIYVAGHNGMVGSSIVKKLNEFGYRNIIVKTRDELNLINQNEVNLFFESEKPSQVFLAAAKVGGIYANNAYPAEFIYNNLMIQNNVIHAAWRNGVQKLIFLGSSCIYPKEVMQPINEKFLLTGKLEQTNEPYAIAKIAGIKLCESYNRQYNVDYRSIMPTNLYGPGDNYHPENAHVIPSLINRFHQAKISNSPVVKIWGTGNPRREFLYVDDMAEASIFIMELEKQIYNSKTSAMQSFINVGFGYDLTIRELALLVKEVVNYEGDIEFDIQKPDGTLKKLLDSSALNDLGWKPRFDLKTGLIKTYEDFKLKKNIYLNIK